MTSINFPKRWKYFGQSPAFVSSEKYLCRVFLDAPDTIRLLPKMKQTKAKIISAIKTKKLKEDVHEKSNMDYIDCDFFKFNYLNLQTV